MLNILASFIHTIRLRKCDLSKKKKKKFSQIIMSKRFFTALGVHVCTKIFLLTMMMLKMKSLNEHGHVV